MRPGDRLREIRIRLGFTVRDVADLSRKLAQQESNEECFISNSWLTQLENHNPVPSIQKLFALSCIYGMSYGELLMIYGLDQRKAVEYHLQLGAQKTHVFAMEIGEPGEGLAVSADLDGLDLRHTTLWSKMSRVWGDIPMEFFRRLNFAGSQYGYIGLEDHTLEPLLRPGTFVQIDPKVKQVQGAWARTEFDRAIYFVKLHDGYACSWCEQVGTDLLLIPHPMSGCRTRRFAYPKDAEIVGRVTAVAMKIAEPDHPKQAVTLDLAAR